MDWTPPTTGSSASHPHRILTPSAKDDCHHQKPCNGSRDKCVFLHVQDRNAKLASTVASQMCVCIIYRHASLSSSVFRPETREKVKVPLNMQLTRKLTVYFRCACISCNFSFTVPYRPFSIKKLKVHLKMPLTKKWLVYFGLKELII